MIDFFEVIKISLFIFGFLNLTVSLYWPGTCNVDKAGLELIEIHLPVPPEYWIQGVCYNAWHDNSILNEKSK